MRTINIFFITCFFQFILGGCLTSPVDRNVDLELWGEINFPKEKRIQEQFEKDDLQVASKEYQDFFRLDNRRLIEGLSFSEGIYKVDPGYRHKILALFEIRPDLKGLDDKHVMGIVPYNDNPVAYAFCNVQWPLKMVLPIIWVSFPGYQALCDSQPIYRVHEAKNSVKHLASLLGGDYAFAHWTYPENSRSDLVGSVKGIIVRLDPSVKMKAPKSSLHIPSPVDRNSKSCECSNRQPCCNQKDDSRPGPSFDSDAPISLKSTER